MTKEYLQDINEKGEYVIVKDIHWEKIGYDGIHKMHVYSIRSNIVDMWVEAQPAHMWKPYDLESAWDNTKEAILWPAFGKSGSTYVFTKEMESWFLLRWT